MKKVYKAPSICVEDARLSAFCSGGCTDSEEYQIYLGIIAGTFGEGSCYCYHGPQDIDALAEQQGYVNMDS